MLHQQLFEPPPAVLALATHSAARNSSPCSPLLPCNCVLPCALKALLWKRLHSHGLASQVYCLVFLWHPSGNACTLTGSPHNPVSPHVLAASLRQRLHSHEQANAQLMTGLPLLLGCNCCQAAIIVELPSSLGCHCCWTAILALFPRATSKRPICCHRQATLSLYSLGLPPNTPFVVAIGLLSPPLSCDQFVCVAR